jgi:hypothetical protein
MDNLFSKYWTNNEDNIFSIIRRVLISWLLLNIFYVKKDGIMKSIDGCIKIYFLPKRTNINIFAKF